jgi:hypothetical protein
VKRNKAEWQQGEPDLVGPAFDAAWGGSAEEEEQASRVAAYTKAVHRRLWGE